MLIAHSALLVILRHYKYLVIFPIAIFEGPIIIIISGVLVYLGVLNVYLTYFLLVVADTIGDSLYYLIGRYWQRTEWIRKIGEFLGYNKKTEVSLENHFRNHKAKTFFIAKFSHGLGSSVQIASGMARVDYFEFVALNLVGTIPKTIILMIIGFYAGNSYLKIDGYLDAIAAFTLTFIVLGLLYVISRRIVKKFLDQK